MEILVLSDSHHKLYNAEKVLNNLKNSVDMIIHCGDHVSDASALSAKYGIKCEAVRGNCDIGSSQGSEKILEVEGKKIFITHGHNYGVKYGLNNLYYKALEEKADVILYGHTHCAEVTHNNGLVILNPGSISEPRDGFYPSYAILSITKGNVFPCLCRVQD